MTNSNKCVKKDTESSLPQLVHKFMQPLRFSHHAQTWSHPAPPPILTPRRCSTSRTAVCSSTSKSVPQRSATRNVNTPNDA